MKKFLHQTPRALAIFYILFLAVFALDVFSPHASVLEIIGGLLIHLIPNYVLIIILYIAWKNEKLGGILFILAAFTLDIVFRNPSPVNLILFAPPALIGILFLLSSRYKKTKWI